MIIHRWRMAATVLGAAYVLTACLPRPTQLASELRSPRAWVADVGPDAAVATLASGLLWLIALWVACGLTAIAVSVLPGRLGRLGRAVTDRVTPAALRRLMITAAGTSIMLSPTAAVAAPATGGPQAPPGAVSALPPLGWPLDPRPGPVTGHGSAPPGAQPRSGDRVTVRPGDSLWSLAAQRLGARPSAARIQAEWPRWYAANRRVIGADPNLLQPGTSLLAPTPTRTDAPT